VETGLETATQNLIHQETVMKGHDKIMRGLESRLDTVQDQLGAIPLGLSHEYEAPTLNGCVAVLVERISSLNSMSANLTEPQVMSWVHHWWLKSDMSPKITKAEKFAVDCESFLTTLVSTIKKQTGDVSTLFLEVKNLTLAVSNVPQAIPPAAPSAASTFATLSQSLGLGASAPAPAATAQTSNVPPTGTAVHASIAALEQKVTDLTLKLAKLHTKKTTATVKFGGAGFSSPRDVLPII
jgi:hypothetical protein